MSTTTEAMAAEAELKNSTWLEKVKEPEGVPDEVLSQWRQLRLALSDVAIARRWSKAEVSRRSGIPQGTFSQWFSGVYKGRYDATNRRVEQFLAAVEESGSLTRVADTAPGFVSTRTAREVESALTYAQMMPEISVVTLSAGLGKTFAARHYIDTRSNAFLVTMSPSTRTVHGMLQEIAASLGVLTYTSVGLHRQIGERLGRAPNTLLILDEAQNLNDDAVDQARSFLDLYQCGLALLGNEEIYTRFERKLDGPSYAQIRRRFGKRLRRTEPYREDISALIDAWGVEDAGARKLLTGIGLKPGALGQIDKTLRLATIIAAGEFGPDAGASAITEAHVKSAWANRGMEF